jgi:mannosyl-3-phosphoglycerate phosphatase
MLPYLIFSDLDGTLLDHDDYSFTQATAALKTIAHLQIPLILNSSKTAAEISEIRIALVNSHPFIVENGAAIIVPDHYFSEEMVAQKIILGVARSDILEQLALLKSLHHFEFKSFDDFSCKELSQETGLSLLQAAMAKDRMASEPLKWLGDAQSLDVFKQKLAEQNLQLLQGGRFFHVMGHTDKGLGMTWLIEQYQKKHLQQFTIIAAGDSPNDLQMLKMADFAVIIRRLDGSCLVLDKDPAQVFNSENPAPLGWQETMQTLFKQLKLEK